MSLTDGLYESSRIIRRNANSTYSGSSSLETRIVTCRRKRSGFNIHRQQVYGKVQYFEHAYYVIQMASQ